MRKNCALLAVLLGLGMAPVWADDVPQVVNATTAPQWTRIVFNDAGSALTSYSVVVWDNEDTEFGQNGYPYVTTTTSADNVWVAGVTLEPSCPDQALCTIVVKGPAITRIANSTDVVVEDTLVATSTVAGEAGDYAPAANTCALGRLIGDGTSATALRQAVTGAGGVLSQNNQPMWVDVNISCQ